MLGTLILNNPLCLQIGIGNKWPAYGLKVVLFILDAFVRIVKILLLIYMHVVCLNVILVLVFAKIFENKYKCS